MDDMDEFKQIFFTECAELLVEMESRLLELEEGVTDADALNAIFRCAHSIKGGSGAFGMNTIMQFTHILEALLDQMRDGKILPSRETIDALLKSADVVTRMLEAAQAGKDVPADFGADVAAALQAFSEGGDVPQAAEEPAPVTMAEPVKASCFEIHFHPHAELFRSGNEPLLILRGLGSLGWLEVEADLSRLPPLDDLPETDCLLGWKLLLFTESAQADVEEVFEFVQHISDITITRIAGEEPQEAPQAVVEEAAPAPAAAVKEKDESGVKPVVTTSIRVDLEKVDRLVNMVGELVITEAMLRAQVRQITSDSHLDLFRGLDELSQHTRELQEAVMAVRMQPVKSIFSRMPRIVRDTSAQLDKDIQLILSGENTEVDKTVIEQLGDPLTHMIRNSVDHGIEKPEKRRELDKPAQGTIHLSAYHRSGRIIIEIRDDGAGIDRARVLAKAKEKGLVAPDANLTDDECDQLIFMPGFSTAEQVTNVSGRGVGMDVVRKNIEALGGAVRVTNMPGQGAIFTVSLPLTLAILDGMIVRVGRENYVIPITSIIETLRPRGEDIRRIPGHNDTINVRGDFISLVYLHRTFGIDGAEGDANDALVVLVESGSEKIGLVVDELIGQQQVVIKSLEANADPVKGISGATILGDGKVSLILEINELYQRRSVPVAEAAQDEPA